MKKEKFFLAAWFSTMRKTGRNTLQPFLGGVMLKFDALKERWKVWREKANIKPAEDNVIQVAVFADLDPLTKPKWYQQFWQGIKGWGTTAFRPTRKKVAVVFSLAILGLVVLVTLVVVKRFNSPEQPLVTTENPPVDSTISISSRLDNLEANDQRQDSVITELDITKQDQGELLADLDARLSDETITRESEQATMWSAITQPAKESGDDAVLSNGELRSTTPRALGNGGKESSSTTAAQGKMLLGSIYLLEDSLRIINDSIRVVISSGRTGWLAEHGALKEKREEIKARRNELISEGNLIIQSGEVKPTTLSPVSTPQAAQERFNITGSWVGQATDAAHIEYRIDAQFTQNPNGSITGYINWQDNWGGRATENVQGFILDGKLSFSGSRLDNILNRKIKYVLGAYFASLVPGGGNSPSLIGGWNNEIPGQFKLCKL